VHRIKQGRNTLFAAKALLKIRFKRSPSLVILTYHRIMPGRSPLRQTEQPGMIATPQALDMHIRLLKQLGAEFVDLDSWLSARRNRQPLPRLGVAATFDDGGLRTGDKKSEGSYGSDPDSQVIWKAITETFIAIKT
jgi:hypothetical protein